MDSKCIVGVNSTGVTTFHGQLVMSLPNPDPDEFDSVWPSAIIFAQETYYPRESALCFFIGEAIRVMDSSRDALPIDILLNGVRYCPIWVQEGHVPDNGNSTIGKRKREREDSSDNSSDDEGLPDIPAV